MSNVTFNQSVKEPVERKDKYKKTQTTPAPYDPKYGILGTKGRTPIGSQGPGGTFTGDFRGLGVVNPWGGKKHKSIRYNIKKRKTRKVRTKSKRRHYR